MPTPTVPSLLEVVNFYATPTGHQAFAEELSKYKQGKGSVQFPLKEPMPLELIKRIVRYRVAENEAKKKVRKAAAGGRKN